VVERREVEPISMQRVDFFRLERPIQERFIAAAQGVTPPLPLALRQEAIPRLVFVWLSLSLAALALLILSWRVGYGQLESTYALQPSALLLLDVLLGGASGLALTLALRRQRAQTALPFTRAIYLFPSGVIDARELAFRVYPIKDLASVSAEGNALVVAFGKGGRFRFVTASPERAREIQRTIEEVKAHLSVDSGARDMAAYDPLSDTGYSSPFSPRESMRPPRPRLASGLSMFAAAAIVGAALGGGLWKLRNFLGEAKLYRAARSANTREAYQAYVDRGGQNSDVRQMLLPRAELAEIAKRHDIDEIEKFAKENRGAHIYPEIHAVLQQELQVTLEAAKRAGTLSALKAFRERFKDQPDIAPALSQAVSERLTGALRDFERRAHPKPEVAELFRKLVNYSAGHEGVVEIRFRRRLPESIARAEMVLEKSNYFGGKASLPGQYFDVAHAIKREEPLGKELVATLAQAFPEDVLRFVVAAPLPDNNDDDPKVSVPTIVVTHRTEMSGAYLMKRPRAALTGVGILFRIVFELPSEPPAHTFKYSSWNAPELKSMLDGNTFEEIYGEIATKAFSKVGKKYLSELVPGLVPKSTP
jgi:hypothetical protein